MTDRSELKKKTALPDQPVNAFNSYPLFCVWKHTFVAMLVKICAYSISLISEKLILSVL